MLLTGESFDGDVLPFIPLSGLGLLPRLSISSELSRKGFRETGLSNDKPFTCFPGLEGPCGAGELGPFRKGLFWDRFRVNPEEGGRWPSNGVIGNQHSTFMQLTAISILI